MPRKALQKIRETYRVKATWCVSFLGQLIDTDSGEAIQVKLASPKCNSGLSMIQLEKSKFRMGVAELLKPKFSAAQTNLSLNQTTRLNLQVELHRLEEQRYS